LLHYRFTDEAAVTSCMRSNALSALLLTLLPSGVAGRVGDKKRKEDRKVLHLLV